MSRINGQIVVYVLVGAVLLLVGLNSIKSEQGSDLTAGVASGATGAEGFGLSSGAGRKLVVDVSGAVRRPGVYRFAHGARVIDAIARAGGVTTDAQVGALNRAATLSDGQQVLVPSASTVANAAGAGVGSVGQAPISLGSATQEQLEEIDGIGPVTAQKILEFRDSRGGLGSVDELDQVSGIGPVTMDSLRSALQP